MYRQTVCILRTIQNAQNIVNRHCKFVYNYGILPSDYYWWTLWLQQYYDSDIKLVSSRVLILPGSDYMRRFGHGYVTIVTDYNDGRSLSIAFLL